jgi:alpha-maltose-1-phosphate synthase
MNTLKNTSLCPPLILGVSLGDPHSPNTYSGVPFHLFEQLRKIGHLVGVADSYIRSPFDYGRGRLDFRRSFCALRPRSNVLWRYRPLGMEILTDRFRKMEKTMPEHDVVLQIGVGAIPLEGKKLVAHVEISVATAINTHAFAKAHGFTGHSSRHIREAIAGERQFLDRCNLVITNSEWTAQGIREQGVGADRLRIYPPAAGIEDPGELSRDWEKCNILFVGTEWERKGGELLIDAFVKVRNAIPSATLTIVGCRPKIRESGVTAVGYLHKERPEELAYLKSLYKDSTIFCMPSHWDSTGIVYMEAALWGLPVVMLRGQGREKIFPSSMAVHIDKSTPDALAEVLIQLGKSPESMASMGKCGREIVLANYMWPKVAQDIVKDIRSI